MPYGLYISADGAEAQSRRIEILAHNMANAGTPGFKRELAVLRAEHAEAIQQGDATAGSGGVDDIGGGVTLEETVTDFSPGPLRKTDIPTDMAIRDEDVFFVVEKDGERFLTRAGNFQLSSEGDLITQQGYSVLSEDGQSIRVDRSVPWRAQENGTITQSGTSVGLMLAKAASLGDLSRAGENLFSPLAPVTVIPPNERSVATGYLEQSAVNQVTEMMELIEASRAFEANVSMIQHQDDAIASLVNRVLRQA